jgi:hypothetical protein
VELVGEGQASTLLQLQQEELPSLARYSVLTLRDFPLSSGRAVDLRLRQIPSPWRADATFLVDGKPYPGGIAAALGEHSFFSGTVLGEESSRVFLAFSEHGTRGWIETGPAGSSQMHLLVSDPQGNGVTRLHHPQQELTRTLPSPQHYCEALYPDGMVPDPVPVMLGGGGGATVADCRLAIETDYQLFQIFGSVPAASTYITQLIAAVSSQFIADVQTSLSIAYLQIYSNSADPWTTPDLPGTTGEMLGEFQAAWTPTWPATADLAHFLSGASLGGGIAYVGVLCNTALGFAVSSSIGGSINWGQFDGSPSHLNWDYVVVAHELGHNFGSLHTHDYHPPIDQCGSSPAICQVGTLMSYCHLCPGGLTNMQLQFHPVVANQIRVAVSGSCLGSADLQTGQSLSYWLQFQPQALLGQRNATLRFLHNASNLASPFDLQLVGNSVP